MAEESNKVEPRTLKGFQDLLPEDVLVRKRIVRTIEEVFERHGFLPIETPVLEYLNVLLGTGGAEVNKELFRLESPEGESIALRFDLTVPFARIVAQYPEKIKPPFRRYAIGPVFRADKPGPGRFRQFTQFDVDIAGADSIAADGEIVAIMCEVMRALHVPSYRALINNRKLIDALLVGAGIADPQRHKHILRVVDKLAKIGPGNVRLELGPGRIDDSGDPIPGVKLDPGAIDRILAFIDVKGTSRRNVLENVAKVLPDSDAARAALDDMRELADVLDAFGVDEDHAWFAPSLTRGLDYYTGPVFEMILPKARNVGSVMGGGRYAELVERFMDRQITGTGMSVGLDRLLAGLEKLKCLRPAKSTVKVLVATLGNVPAAETVRVAAELRAAGIATEAYFGKKMRMKEQLSHADRWDIPVAVILGEDELANGQISVKGLRSGRNLKQGIGSREDYMKAGTQTQVTVPRASLVNTVRDLLQKEDGEGP